jgi:hypothetical protein
LCTYIGRAIGEGCDPIDARHIPCLPVVVLAHCPSCSSRRRVLLPRPSRAAPPAPPASAVHPWPRGRPHRLAAPPIGQPPPPPRPLIWSPLTLVLPTPPPARRGSDAPTTARHRLHHPGSTTTSLLRHRLVFPRLVQLRFKEENPFPVAPSLVEEEDVAKWAGWRPVRALRDLVFASLYMFFPSQNRHHHRSRNGPSPPRGLAGRPPSPIPLLTSVR